jgi:hypothetical protein
MRDAGYNFHAYDKFAVPFFVNYFTADDFRSLGPKLDTAFEVFEHFPDPATSISELLSVSPDLIVFSTSFYDGQDDDWPYYVPECGQHVFFYSERGIKEFAAKFGYMLYLVGSLQVLVRPTSYDERLESLFDTFARDAPQLYQNTATRLVNSVVFGSSATMADLDTARQRLVEEIAEMGVV